MYVIYSSSMRFSCIIIIVSYAVATFCHCDKIDNKTDLRLCKITHMGLCYTGTISRTGQGLRCQRWATDAPVHKVDKAITSNDFPERSMAKAKNYCRNPTRVMEGPWCYTMNPSVEYESCDIPLCMHSKCRITGPGMEYGGKMSRSTTSQKCKKWSKNWSNKKLNLPNGTITNAQKFPRFRFPSRDVGTAGKNCRNPDGDLGGPWCYTEQAEESDLFLKEYCDVPFCDDRDCELYSKQGNYYSHFISFNQSAPNITFSVRLWDPDQEVTGVVKILLSILCVPASPSDIVRWGTGIELTITNEDTVMTIGNIEIFNEHTPHVLKATEYTDFILSWSDNVLVLGKPGVIKPLYTNEIDKIGELLKLSNMTFKYYSVAGSEAMWDLPFCEDEYVCEEHTTFKPHPLFFWPLRQKHLNYELEIWVRSYSSAIVYLVREPYHEFPRINIVLGVSENVSEIFYQAAPNMRVVPLAQVTYPYLLDYWEWTELHFIIFSQEMQIFLNVEGRLEMIFKVKHELMNALRWFSLGSDHSITHWSVYCQPPDMPPAYPPDCALTQSEFGYSGDQWVTGSGLPCIPWIDNSTVSKGYQNNSLFVNGTVANVNYCRNIKRRDTGPWCYALSAKGVKEEVCDVRRCSALDCKVAGTANDYAGDTSTTRSGRKCKKWTDVSKKWSNLQNGSLYPEGDVHKVNNFCRNPTRSLVGAWCYTTDDRLERDLCDIEDCSKEETNIVLTRNGGAFRYIYILPEWKYMGDEGGGLRFSLKEWNPDFLDGILFKVFSSDKQMSLTLYVGAKDNEKVILEFEDHSKNSKKLLVEKSILHLIPAGKWGNFWLQTLKGGIRLGYPKTENAIFEWETDDDHLTFEPSFMSYQSIEGNVIGVYFPDTQCHAEVTTTLQHTRIFPIRMWRTPLEKDYSNLTVYLRGTGIALIPLLDFPGDTENYLAVTIGDEGNYIFIIRNDLPKAHTLTSRKFNYPLIVPDKWTRYDIFHNEHVLIVYRNDEAIMGWKPDVALVVYFFAMSCEKGWLLWTVNCAPPDIDSAPVDGGWSQWSEWHCSVTCGKGIGMRTRTCDNPKPNIFGKMCEGSALDTGPCSEFECGQISPETYDLIRWRLRHEYFSIRAAEGDEVSFVSPVDIIDRIRRESPLSDVRWTHKGTVLSMPTEKYSVVNDTITVKNVDQADGGTYLCLVYADDDTRTPLRAVVVAVEPSRTDKVLIEGSRMFLMCKTAPLPLVYTDLDIKLYLNNTLYSNTDVASPLTADGIRIRRVQFHHSGIWHCSVEQYDLGFRWVTAIYKVKVKERPSFLHHLMEDKLTRVIFGNMSSVNVIAVAIAIFVVFIIISVALGTVCYLCFSKGWKKRKANLPDNIHTFRRSERSQFNVRNYDYGVKSSRNESELIPLVKTSYKDEKIFSTLTENDSEDIDDTY